MTPTESLYKKYKPDFTQLPANFIEKDIGLRKLVRTKGDRYVSVYIAIQDGMGSHSAEDFTLSFDEMTDVVNLPYSIALMEDLFTFCLENSPAKPMVKELQKRLREEMEEF